MNGQLLVGELVRLCAFNSAADVETVLRWDQDTEYLRLLITDPVEPPTTKATRERMERPGKDAFLTFAVRTLADDRLIGHTSLMHINHANGNAWVGIGMGDPDYRGRGYGTDTMRVVLRYAFQELNLHRVSLDAVAENLRAVRSYEKSGFVLEGRTRGTEYRDRVRGDLVTMGILRSEWEKKESEK